MKTKILLIFIAILAFSCKNEKPNEEIDSTVETISEPLKIEGAWELVSFYNYTDNKVVDSYKTQEGYRQVKIYTPSKVMWSKNVPTDSTEWFGYGSYKIENGQLMETLDYGSKMMKIRIQENKEFVFELNLSKDSFSQIELDEDGNRIFSENYQRIE